MAASSLVDLVKIYATNQGTGALTLGEAVQGYRGVEALLNGATYSYSIQQDAQWEIGKATYLAVDNQLVRTPTDSSNGGGAVDFQANAAVAFVALSEDILARDVLQPLYGFGPPLPGQGLIGQTYTDLTQPVTLYGPKTANGWGSGVSLQGAPGTAASYKTLDELKAARPESLFYVLLGPTGGTNYALTPGDFTDQVDDVDVIKLNDVPLATGALVRQGADSISYASALVPAPRRPVNRVLDDQPTLPSLGVTVDGTPQANSSKLAEIMAKAKDIALGTATPPRIHVPAGIYRYDTSPNFAVQGLHIDCEPGAVFHHTGAGNAFVADGGASQGGIKALKVTGGLVIRGNTNTQDGLWNRAVHQSLFDVEVQSVSGAALRTNWVVCNEYRFCYNPLFRPAFNPVATVGMFLSSRNPGEKTSACTFYNPVIGGVNGYAINLNDAIVNKIISGTAETSVGGLYIGPDSLGNNIDGLDIEFNTSIDVFCQGLFNEIYVKVSDSNSTISGLKNYVRGGLWNALTNIGEYNEFDSLNFGIAGGAFTDSGTNTVYRSMRNAFGGVFLPDRVRRPQEGRYLTALNGIGYWEASADQITGGSVNDTYHYKYGGGKDVFGGPGGDRFGHSAAGIGFYDKAATPVAKQTVSGARGESAALADLITKLAALGIITDGTTA